jgi:hypothetical protein
MSAERLPRIAAACFLIGLAMVFLIDLGIARIIGIPLTFIGIGLGVASIATPAFLEADEDAAS